MAGGFRPGAALRFAPRLWYEVGPLDLREIGFVRFRPLWERKKTSACAGRAADSANLTGENPASDYVPPRIMMKLHKNLLIKLSVAPVLLAVLMLGSCGAFAQMPGNDTAVLSVMVKLFGTNPAFAAKAEMHV